MPSSRRKYAGATSSFKCFQRSNWYNFEPPEGQQEKDTSTSLNFLELATASPAKIRLVSVSFSCCYFSESFLD